jgi:hypothetical protein
VALNRHVRLASYQRHQFASHYTRDDVLLLAKTDTAHKLQEGRTEVIVRNELYRLGGQKDQVYVLGKLTP